MYKSNLIELISSLNNKEFNELGDFLLSPYFNKNEGIIKLYQYLKNLYPDFDEINVDKEITFRKIFHGAAYNDDFMRSLMFKLSTLIQEFMAISDFRKNKPVFNIQVADSLLDRNLDDAGAKLIKQTSGKLSGQKNINGDYYYSLYKLETLSHIIYSRVYSPLTVKDKPDESLINESDYLIRFFLIKILQRYRYLLNKSKTVSASYNLDFLDEVLEYLKNDGKKFLEMNLLNILYKQVLLLINPDDINVFNELYEILTNDNIPLDKEERRNGLTVVNNFCIDRVYEGKEEYRLILHNMNVYELERGLYSRVKGGYFEISMFNNIVTIALALKKEEWVHDFIEKYHTKLSPDIRTNTYNFAYAKYYFSLKEFENSLMHMNRVTFTDIYLKFHGRILNICIHYELGNLETFFNALDSFRKFIANDKLLTKEHKIINSNFIRFAVALGKIRSGGSNEELEILKNNISECESLSYRKWLLAKAYELAKYK